MNSCLYKATVMHHRLLPKVHRFHYNVFMFYIDLEELPLLQKKLWMFSHNRFNFFSFRDKEHLQLPIDRPDTTKTTVQHIHDYLAQHGLGDRVKKMMLLTNMNVLGYNFNPVSFYFCFDRQEAPVCCIAEVSNTFREMKPYIMQREQFSKNKFSLLTAKYFYVSPFAAHDTVFDFNLHVPAETLNMKIDDYKDDTRFFISTLTGKRKQLTNSVLLWYSIRFPFITLRIITLIHWNALLLWLKKLPYQRKSENQHLQADVYRKYKIKH